MKTAASQQIEFGGLNEGTSADHSKGSARESTLTSVGPDASASIPSNLSVPNFGAKGTIYALASRMAGRINAAGVSDDEHNALLAERQDLLNKEFEGTISPKQRHRLEYVRWSLDRIEDAKYGSSLDILEDSVSVYERFVQDINSLRLQLESYRGKPK